MAEICKSLVCDEQIALTVIKSTDIVNKAIEYFELSPVAAAALGRMLSVCSMMGVQLKNPDDCMTAVINGGGDIGVMTVTALSNGNVKGYVTNPQVESFVNEKGKLDVGRAVGCKGRIVVTKNMGLKHPYVGAGELVSGEIAEDFANYLASSEQARCGVALGVKIAPDGSCVSAGGILASVLPFADDESIDKFEKVFSPLSNVSALMEDKTAWEFTEKYFGELGVKKTEELQCAYVCDCNRSRIDKAIISLTKEDIDELVEQNGEVEVICHFCNKKYKYTKQQAYEVCGFKE